MVIILFQKQKKKNLAIILASGQISNSIITDTHADFVTYNQISAIKETILMHKHTFLPSFPLLLSLTFATLGSNPMGRSN